MYLKPGPYYQIPLSLSMGISEEVALLLGEGNGNPLQYSCLENPMDGGAWWAAVYGVAQSRTRLKRLSSSPYIFAGDKESACSAGVAGDAGLIPGQEDPLKEAWQPTPVFLAGESHGQRNLEGFCP